MTAPSREQVLGLITAASHRLPPLPLEWIAEIDSFCALAYAAGLAEGARQEREACITCGHSPLTSNGQGKYWCSPCSARLFREQNAADAQPAIVDARRMQWYAEGKEEK